MSNTETAELESFSVGILEQISPFTVDFDLTTMTTRPTKAGGTYPVWNIVVKSAKYTNKLRIMNVPGKIYEKMRLLRLSGIKNLSATEGTADVKGFRPIIISGAATFQ